MINSVKAEFMRELLYRIPIDCVAIPNVVASECIRTQFCTNVSKDLELIATYEHMST